MTMKYEFDIAGTNSSLTWSKFSFGPNQVESQLKVVVYLIITF